MNIITYSPALVLAYVFALLWVLMGIDFKTFTPLQRWLILCFLLLLGAANHLMRELTGPAVYGKFLVPFLHLPTFVLFLHIAKRGVIKTAFMILSATVFTAPTVLIGNVVRRILFVGSPQALLLSNLISYVLMLLLAQFVFRNGFNYLLAYGDNRLFLLFSVVPFIFYIYVLATVNLDFSSLSSLSGYIVRFLPVIEVFFLYFLLPYVYKSLREKQTMKSAQTAMQQKLVSVQDRITLLNEINTQMAVYRHDMRHQLIVLDGLLSNGKIAQAQEFVKTVMADLDAITPEHFCENETVNLLCSSYARKARQLGITLTINALLPKKLSLSDTELCSVVSNGLENALAAASHPEISDKWVDFYCEFKQDKLLIQIQNPYVGQVVIRDGLPVSTQEGHGYGCRSVQAIAQHNGGLCSFEAKDALFTFRLILPLPTAQI